MLRLRHDSSARPAAWILAPAVALLFGVMAPLYAGTGVLLASTATAGITITATAGNNAQTTFGNVNALGIGTIVAGVTPLVQSNGTLYITTYQLGLTQGFPGNHTAKVTALVSTNFSNPAVLAVWSCPAGGGCTTFSSFSAMPLVAGPATTIVPSLSKGTPAVAGIALWVPNSTGFAGSYSATVTFTATDNNSANAFVDSTALAIVNNTVQTSVQLTLTTATGGLTISAGASPPDYAADFGNVNGLGIGPAGGLAVLAGSGSATYTTAYTLNPSFSGFGPSTATLSVYVSSNFAHPAILKLQDAGVAAGPYSDISTSSVAPTQLTASAASGAQITRNLGLFVSGVNGASAFAGSDSARLTFTMTVP